MTLESIQIQTTLPRLPASPPTDMVDTTGVK